MKRAAASRSILDDIPRRVFDQSALTADEIMSEAGLSRWMVRTLVSTNVKAGKWQRVMKVAANGRAVPAYRRAG